MKKLLFVILASTIGVTACASNGSSDNVRDHNKQRPAMSADMKQAMDDCAKRAGVKTTKDSRLSQSDIKKIDACMSAKGYQMPQGQGRPSR
ncbi:MAG: hypothetical protein L0G25_08995 [Psychrobacter sp.]|nr:hypothetical protein [Psychrobacter sp.]